MRRLLICSMPAILLAYAGSAVASSPTLKGVYAFTGTAGCLVSASNPTGQAGGPSAGGFNSDLEPVPGARMWSQSFSVEGVRTFNGDGTGTIKGTSVSVTVPPTPAGFTCPNAGCFRPSASSSQFTASF